MQGVGVTNPGICWPCLGPTWNSCPGRIRKGSESCNPSQPPISKYQKAFLSQRRLGLRIVQLGL